MSRSTLINPIVTSVYGANECCCTRCGSAILELNRHTCRECEDQLNKEFIELMESTEFQDEQPYPSCDY